MATPSIAATVFKLAVAGEQAGFSLEHMIQLLNAGVTVETLMRLIEFRISRVPITPSELRTSRWVM